MGLENEDAGLWCHQNCIDQGNTSEKRVAIGAMDLVYKSVRAVVIALDDIELEENEVSSLRDHISEYEAIAEPENLPFLSRGPPSLMENTTLLFLVSKIISSTYFSRVWSLHELRQGIRHVYLVRCSTRKDTSHLYLRFTDAFLFHLLALGTDVKPHLNFDEFDIAKRSLRPKILGVYCIFVRLTWRESPAAKGPISEDQLLANGYVRVSTEVFNSIAGGDPNLPAEHRPYDVNADKISIVPNTLDSHLIFDIFKVVGHDITVLTDDECFRQLLLLALTAGDLAAYVQPEIPSSCAAEEIPIPLFLASKASGSRHYDRSGSKT